MVFWPSALTGSPSPCVGLLLLWVATAECVSLGVATARTSWLRGGGQQLVTKLLGGTGEAFDDPEPIRLLIGGHFLSDVGQAVLEKSIQARGDLAGGGHHGLWSTGPCLNAAIEST
jgi:hypothetical protein